jgi:hypoxanthine-guanine phosphoribosyltransferase
MLEKFKAKIEELEVKKQKILTDVKDRKIISVDGIIKAGQDLELIRVKIWAIEEALYQ